VRLQEQGAVWCQQEDAGAEHGGDLPCPLVKGGQVATLVEAARSGQGGEGEGVGGDLRLDRARQCLGSTFEPVIKGLAIAADRGPNSDGADCKRREEGRSHKGYDVCSKAG
jgi:hypothetical protein